VRSKVFSEVISIHFIATLVLSVVYVALFMTIQGLSAYRQLFLVSTGTLYTQVFTIEWLFQGVEQFRVIALRGIVSKFIALVSIFLFVKNESDTVIYYIITLFVSLLSVAINLSYARAFVEIRLLGMELKRHLKPMLYILSFGLVTQVYTVLDAVILGFLRGESEVGYYTVATKLVRVLIMTLTAITMVMVPRMAGYFNDNRINEA